MSREKIKVTLSELHGYLDGLSWRLLGIAARLQDRELVDVYLDVQKFIDAAIFGPEGRRPDT